MVTACKATVLRWGLPFVLAVVLTLIAPVRGLQAQDYSFTVDRNIVAVHIKQDGSIDIEYWITFTVDRGAPPIDVVDVGFPNDYYNLSSVTADIDGTPITDIRRSPALSIGVRAYLGPHAIPAGSTGTFHLVANNPHMVYPDTADEMYASMKFSPTWYGSRYTHGRTHLEVTIYFPPGVGPDETRYHRTKFTEARMEGDTPVMTWTSSRARPDKQYMFGVSFPKKYVSQVFPAPRKVTGKYPGRKVRRGDGAGTLIFFVAAVGVIGGIVAAVKTRNRRRKMRYLPPKIKVEGVQVKKGLTAVEAAIVAETRLDRVLSMILFGLVKKGIVRVKSAKPLRLEVLRKDWRRKKEVVGKVEIRDYETDFLSAIGKSGTLRKRDLKEMLIRLIRSVQRKMKWFAARPTTAYYREVVDKAWRQVKEADTPEVIEENLEWAMLDEDFEKKMTKTMEGRYVLAPTWYRAYGGRTVGTTSGAEAGPAVPVMLPGSLFAHDIVSGFETGANNIVSDVVSFSEGVTNVTNPPPPPSSSSWGGGGGGGCACACACAGCACACAGGGA